MRRKSLLFNPPAVFIATWAMIALLFELRLSSRLAAPSEEIQRLLFVILGGYLIGAAGSLLFAQKVALRLRRRLSRRQWRGAVGLLCALLALAAAEAAIEGFVPAVALLQGRQISHFDFGIPSVHGLVIAGLCALGSFFFAVHCFTGSRLALILALLPLIYAAAFVHRKMFTVCFLQYAVIFFYSRPLRLRTILAGALALPAFVYAFGAFGDLRGRTEVIERFGGFAEEFVFPGDTGVKWVYLYLTTPIDNLSFTTREFPAEQNTDLQRTLGPIVPSALSRLAAAPVEAAAGRFQAAAEERYWLQSPMFNVSTGFNPAYLDLGIPGIVGFAAVIGFLTTFAYCRFRGELGTATYAALLTGALLTVFSNSFSNLNYVGQALFLLMVRYPVVLRRFG
ncbi:oligosaccharide repeat unit polymerase [Pseudoroseicyclus tamaricis]|uniref:Oligosaccharide repeat unit polymerase n=1 Tax=Pseudoroseicyclus tamaricis TaxID=2705421 RepID=A0A6B2JUM1_9RHOB|nr:oligosaccharide repeat unit polymerase [Pseudoroseicyclus tamaricis]NDU99873.1 oligosaccharide repeat unit polymerase [Pseudoroseicyclus tamaricis]